MKITVWRLGDLENNLYPTKEAFEKLTNFLLEARQNNHDCDLVWGPDLKVFEVEINNDDICVLSCKDKNIIQTLGEKNESN